jgi:hypothetical protein
MAHKNGQKMTFVSFASAPPLGGRSLRRLWVALLITAVIAPVTIVAGASPASANTSDFRGMNWARLGDNFTTGPLVLEGLSSSDSYTTVRAKANSLYDDMEASMGVNTVRLPINTHTVGTTWWNAYRGTIDVATDRGFKVILTYWEDGASSGGRITDMAAFNSMWSNVTNTYGSNSLVYFEPMNEPHGYSSTEWRDVAANWLDYHYSAPANRVLVGGTGYSSDLRDICNDSRFDNTLLSFHHYAFMFGSNTYDGWRSHIQTRLGNCADRAVATEYGAPMDNGLNYADANSTENFVRHIRAMAQVMRDNNMGGSYWPALGGKVTGTSGYDWYSMFALSGSGTDLSLTVRNTSGADRVRYGWGDTISDGGTSSARITNRHSGLVMDVDNASTTNGAAVIQYPENGNNWQRWNIVSVGDGYVNIRNVHSNKCLDVSGSANGSSVVQWDCWGGTNQQFTLQDAGSGYVRIIDRRSGRCVDVPDWSTANATALQVWDCHTGNNQQWAIATP